MRKKRQINDGFMSITRLILREKDQIIKRGLYEEDEISFQDFKHRTMVKIILKKKGKHRSKEQLKYLQKLFSGFEVFDEI